MVQTDDKTLDQLNEEADIAADYLEGLLDIADYEGDIEMGVRNGRPMVQIVADDDTDIKHLIGKNGEVGDALQQLLLLAGRQEILLLVPPEAILDPHTGTSFLLDGPILARHAKAYLKKISSFPLAGL